MPTKTKEQKAKRDGLALTKTPDNLPGYLLQYFDGNRLRSLGYVEIEKSSVTIRRIGDTLRVTEDRFSSEDDLISHIKNIKDTTTNKRFLLEVKCKSSLVIDEIRRKISNNGGKVSSIDSTSVQESWVHYQVEVYTNKKALSRIITQTSALAGSIKVLEEGEDPLEESTEPEKDKKKDVVDIHTKKVKHYASFGLDHLEDIREVVKEFNRHNAQIIKIQGDGNSSEKKPYRLEVWFRSTIDESDRIRLGIRELSDVEICYFRISANQKPASNKERAVLEIKADRDAFFPHNKKDDFNLDVIDVLDPLPSLSKKIVDVIEIKRIDTKGKMSTFLLTIYTTKDYIKQLLESDIYSSVKVLEQGHMAKT